MNEFDWASLGSGVNTAIRSANIDQVAANSMVAALDSPDVQSRLNREYMKAAAILVGAVATGIVVGTQIARRT